MSDASADASQWMAEVWDPALRACLSDVHKPIRTEMEQRIMALAREFVGQGNVIVDVPRYIAASREMFCAEMGYSNPPEPGEEKRCACCRKDLAAGTC